MMVNMNSSEYQVTIKSANQKVDDYVTKCNPEWSVNKLKYKGCIGVKTSMRSLDCRKRSEVAKESINRLCNRKFDRERSDQINMILEDEPNLDHSGTDVLLSVTGTHLNVIDRDTKQIIIEHEMRNVSFASSGDEDTLDFVAYVAKDEIFGRACFVLECGLETSKALLDKIARAFQLRIQILNNNETNFSDTSSAVIASTRASLEKEPWYHGSYLSREESETRLKQDGDFLVRESMLEHGHFVLSVMNDGAKLHLLFDSIGQVRTKQMVFNDISHLVKFHHENGYQLRADNRVVYLRNAVRPTLNRN